MASLDIKINLFICERCGHKFLSTRRICDTCDCCETLVSLKPSKKPIENGEVHILEKDSG